MRAVAFDFACGLVFAAFDPAIPDRVPAAVGVAGPGEARAGTAAPMAANSSMVAPESAGTRVTVVNSGKPGLLW
ncbi:hypothetical protein ACG3RR_32555 [Pseudomonas aeruginosa]|uniref:hypothetical protein n=1 Tax=Pseudomonas aeruginosa TaxID=287 RepID=UPI003748189C